LKIKNLPALCGWMVLVIGTTVIIDSALIVERFGTVYDQSFSRSKWLWIVVKAFTDYLAA